MCILYTVLITILVEAIAFISYRVYKKIKANKLETKRGMLIDSLQERRDVDNLTELLCNRSYKERDYRIMNSIKRFLLR